MNASNLIGNMSIFAGAMAVVYGLVFVRIKAARTLQWPGVVGTIISSDIEKEAMNTFGSNFASGNTVYQPKVKYKYEVSGRKFINNVIKPCGNLAISIPGRAQKTIQKYQKGDEVMVFYNPDKPQDSCLEQTEEVSVFYVGMGLVFIIFGYFF